MGRRRRLGRRAQHRWVVGGSAVIAVLLAAEPTGTPIVDQLWSAAFVAFVTWVGGHARRDLVLVSAGLATALAATGLSLMLGVAAVGLSAVHALMASRHLRLNTAGAGLVALSLLVGSGPDDRWLAAVATTAVVAILLVAGSAGMSERGRRLTTKLVLGAGTATVAAVLLSAVALLLSKADVDRGVDAFRAAREASRAGDVEVARSQFALAERALGDARSPLRTLALPARAVPGLAQQVRAGSAAVDAAGSAATGARRATDELELSRVRMVSGAIDLDALAAAEAPLGDLVAVLDRTLHRLERIDRTLLSGPVSRLLDEATDEAIEAGRDAERLQRAVQIAPDLLGASGPRRYLVLFTTPVEARNRFGFPGSFAVMRADEGRLTFEVSGPIQDLFPDQPFDQSVLALPARAQPYQPFGVSREWRSVTIPADFPAAAGTAAQLAEQSPIGPVDGVVLAGPEAAAAVVGLVGGIELPEVGVTLTEETTVEFVTVRQYLEFPEVGDQAERKDLLADIAELVGERLETATLPELGDLIDTFAPLVRAGQLHLSVPTGVSPAAAALLAETHLDGGMPEPDGDLLHVGHLNAAGNKIDLYLRRRLAYDVEIADDGTLVAELTLTLENHAPDQGRPAYLIGSVVDGLPVGTNRTTLLLYSPHELLELAFEGVPAPFTAIADGGLFVYQAQVDLGPGETVTVTAGLRGTAPPNESYRLRLLPNGLLHPDETTVGLADARSRTVGEVTMTVDEPTIVTTLRGDTITQR